MNQPTSFRDAELISAYLDGQLSPVQKTALEARLKTEPQLREILVELSQARALLRKLPARRAPRNFTLSPKMAGVRPPLPASFSIFRFASALAAILFFFAFTANLSGPALATFAAVAPAPILGRGGGGDASALEAPAAPLAAVPAPENASSPTATAEYSIMQDLPTQQVEPLMATEVAAEPSNPQAKLAPEPQPDPGVQTPNSLPDQTGNAIPAQPIAQLVPASLQYVLLSIAVLLGALTLVIQYRADSSWGKNHAAKSSGLGMRQILLLVLVLLFVVGLAFGIYWISNNTFYMPSAAQNLYAGGDKGPQVLVDKGAQPAESPISQGDKGGSNPEEQQSIVLSPGTGYNLAVQISSEELTAFDFPAGLFPYELPVTYLAGQGGLPIEASWYVDRAFTLLPGDKNIEPLSSYVITLDYSAVLANTIDENILQLYWWSGQDWVDAGQTCESITTPDRQPDINRVGFTVCKMGTFIFVAP